MAIKIWVFRRHRTPYCVIGDMVLSNIVNKDSLWLKSIELPWRDNQPYISCIKPDTYCSRLEFHPSFGYKVVRLENKHGRTGILIHRANWAIRPEDEHKVLAGCIGPGMTENKKASFIGESKKAMDKIEAYCNKYIPQKADEWGKITVSIKEDFVD